MSDYDTLRRGSHVVHLMHAHLVFVTKYRHEVFDAEHLQRLKEIFADVCEDFEAELVEFNGETEHVHLLVTFPPKVAVARLVNSLKGVPRAGAALLAGQTAVVRFLLRRVSRRGTHQCAATVHREPAETGGRSTSGLKAGALSP